MSDDRNTQEEGSRAKKKTAPVTAEDAPAPAPTEPVAPTGETPSDAELEKAKADQAKADAAAKARAEADAAAKAKAEADAKAQAEAAAKAQAEADAKAQAEAAAKAEAEAAAKAQAEAAAKAEAEAAARADAAARAAAQAEADAKAARAESETAKADAARARDEAMLARAEVDTLRADAARAKASEAETARLEAEKAAREAAAETAKFDVVVPIDDPDPNPELWEMKKQRALADVSKPLEPAAEAIWSAEPDKKKARETLETAYRDAVREGSRLKAEGDLRRRYRALHEKFVNAAADMLRSQQDVVEKPQKLKESHLVTWLNTFLAAGQEPGKAVVREALADRQQVEARLEKRMGPRELARQKAAEATKRWETAFARWSSPEKEIAAVMASYADRIDQLNADINTGNNRDQAIFSFWFEVAPLHLQLRYAELDDEGGSGLVDDEVAPGVTKIRKALTDFEELKSNYEAGAQRNDGSIYFLKPEPDTATVPDPRRGDRNLAEKRQRILEKWQKAAAKQAAAEADYAARPDAAADLKPRHDKLKGDGWVKGTREALAKPKP